MLTTTTTESEKEIARLRDENKRLRHEIKHLNAQLDQDSQAQRIKKLQDECDRKQIAILAVPAHFNEKIIKLRQKVSELEAELAVMSKVNYNK